MDNVSRISTDQTTDRCFLLWTVMTLRSTVLFSVAGTNLYSYFSVLCHVFSAVYTVFVVFLCIFMTCRRARIFADTLVVRSPKSHWVLQSLMQSLIPPSSRLYNLLLWVNIWVSGYCTLCHCLVLSTKTNKESNTTLWIWAQFLRHTI